MKLHNLVEDHALEAYTQVRTHFPTFCGCDLCRGDVLVYALNRLPARYVASLEGSVLTEINLDRNQMRAQIDVAMVDAVRRVALVPRCGTVEPQSL